MSFWADLKNLGARERVDDARLPNVLLLLVTALGVGLSSFEQTTIFLDREVGQIRYLIGAIFLLIGFYLAYQHLVMKDEPEENGEVYYHHPRSIRTAAKFGFVILLIATIAMGISIYSSYRPLPMALRGKLRCPEGKPAADYRVELLDADRQILQLKGEYLTDTRGDFGISAVRPVQRKGFIRFTSPSGVSTVHNLDKYKNDDDRETPIFKPDYCN